MKTLCYTAFFAALACQAGAEQASSGDILDMLRTADGSARVLMAGDVDMNLLEGVLVSLAEAPAYAVRFGVADNVPNRDAILNRLDEAGLDAWAVCDLWLTRKGSPDEFVYKGMLEMLEVNGGSIVVLDNGDNDEDRYSSHGEDPNLGRDENPIIFGFLDPVTDWGLLADPVQYEAMWNGFVFNFPLDLTQAGCR